MLPRGHGGGVLPRGDLHGEHELRLRGDGDGVRFRSGPCRPDGDVLPEEEVIDTAAILLVLSFAAGAGSLLSPGGSSILTLIQYIAIFTALLLVVLDRKQNAD